MADEVVVVDAECDGAAIELQPATTAEALSTTRAITQACTILRVPRPAIAER
jgi:hypothetical protein